MTGTGKVYHRHQGLNHILSKKTSHRKRTLSVDGVLNDTDCATLKLLIPYKKP